MKKNYLYLFILLALTIPSIFALLQPGFFESDDGEWMVIRFSAFYQALSDGQFPVRFLERLNFGYGYPVPNFLYPGFMYLAVPLKLLGLSFVSSVKAIFIISMLGGGFFAFKWLSKIFDEKSAFVGALFYTYTPYHLYDLYKRGSVGEVLAIAILPFVLWQIERGNFYLVSVGIFLMILAHNSLAVLFLLFLTSYIGLSIYVSKKKKELSKNFLISLSLGIGMGSFFWLPALFELRFTNFSQTKISEWANYFTDVSLIGTSSLLVIGMVVGLIFMGKIKVREHRLTFLFLIISAISILMSVSLSSPFWQVLPTSWIQFPFRFLSVLLPTIAFLAACIVFILGKKSRNIFAILLIVTLFISSFSFLNPETKTNKEDSFYSTNEDTTNVKDEYLPFWVKEKPEKRFEEKVELLGEGEIREITHNSKIIRFKSESDNKVQARVNTIYYPGWEASVNGKKVDIDYSNNMGVMDVEIPAGISEVELRFNETGFRTLADLLSVVSALILLVWSSRKVAWIFKLNK